MVVAVVVVAAFMVVVISLVVGVMVVAAVALVVPLPIYRNLFYRWLEIPIYILDMTS